MRKLRRKINEEENPDRWVVSYADFVTLLFAFFTTLYAISAVDSDKLKTFVGSMREAFKARQIINTTVNVPHLVPPAVGNGYVASEIEKIIDQDKNRGKYSIKRDKRGIIVSIGSAVLFESGSTELKESAYESFEPIAMIVKRIPNLVVIEGHTDNIPPVRNSSVSNWELSTLRAVNVLKYLQSHFNINSSRLSAGGYAEFRPVADNSTPEGRAKNRRVDLVILMNREKNPNNNEI